MSDLDSSVSGSESVQGEWIVAGRRKKNKKMTINNSIQGNEQEETVPKSIFEPLVVQQTVSTSPGSTQTQHGGQPERPASSEPVPIDELIPATATSAEKKQLLAESDRVFSGRYSPAAVSCVLATLDESDLRELRDMLHAALSAAVPAAAGRPLCRRIVGNLPGLVDDCWALGYSAAQGVLTQRANTATLRPAGRNPLPPPGPLRHASSASSMAPSPVTASLEAIISTQLRLEREVGELRARHTNRVSIDQVRSLETEVANLRVECAARDARIEHLTQLVEDLLAREDQHRSRSAVLGPVPAPECREESAAPATDAPAVTSATQANGSAAREIAASLDLRALGDAIASSLQWRIGESDSEPEQSPASASRRRGPGQPPDRPRAAPIQTAATASSVPAADTGDVPLRRETVTGSGPPSDLVQDAANREESRTEKFILEGVRMSATDRDVRSLVWSVVRNLYDFQRLPRRGNAPSVTRAFLIEVDAGDADRVMDPSRWPTGLVVRRSTRVTTTGRQGQSFRRAGTAAGRPPAPRRAEHEGALWQAAALGRAGHPNQGTERATSAAHRHAAQAQPEDCRWEAAAAPRHPRAPYAGAAHDAGTSWAAVASRRDGGDITGSDGGDGVWETAASHRDAPSAHTGYYRYGQSEREPSSWGEYPAGGSWGAVGTRRRRRARWNGGGRPESGWER